MPHTGNTKVRRWGIYKLDWGLSVAEAAVTRGYGPMQLITIICYFEASWLRSLHAVFLWLKMKGFPLRTLLCEIAKKKEKKGISHLC